MTIHQASLSGVGSRGWFRDLNYNIVGPGEDELEDLVSFVQVSSCFYPELEKWYQIEAFEWFIDRLSELDLNE